LKLYRKLTHADIPGVPRLDLEAIDEYRRGIEPLAGAGKIGALLAQFLQVSSRPRSRGAISMLCCSGFATTRSPSNCGIGAGVTISDPPCPC
jgi:hypothetical protein